MAASLPGLLAPAVGAGFAMDWVTVSKAGVAVAPPPSQGTAGQQAKEPAGSYEAIRVYLWVGMADPGTPGRQVILSLLPAMKQTVDQMGMPPEQVSATGRVMRAEAPIGFSAAVIPYLSALGDRDAATRLSQRVRAAVDGQTGLEGSPATYYDQNLSLFSTGFTEGRFRFNRDGQLSVSW